MFKLKLKLPIRVFFYAKDALFGHIQVQNVSLEFNPYRSCYIKRLKLSIESFTSSAASLHEAVLFLGVYSCF